MRHQLAMSRLQLFLVTLGTTILGKALDWVGKPIVSRNIEDALEKREGHTFLSRALAFLQEWRPSEMLPDGFFWGAFTVLAIWGIAEAWSYWRRRREARQFVQAATVEQFQQWGSSAVAVADEINKYLGNADSIISVDKCLAEVYSLLIRLNQAGMVIPSWALERLEKEQQLPHYASYLYRIGPLLRDGLLSEAYETAKFKVMDIAEEVESPRPRSPRSTAKGKRR
jgi:hypothetical protein